MSGSLPERLAREAVRSVNEMDVDDPRTREDEIARVCAAAIRQALDEALAIARDGIDEDGGYAPDPGLNRALNQRTWAARRKIAAAIEALKT